LNDELATLARENDVMLTISTDSHTLENFHFMKLGVFIARRAWCRANDILNTRSWKEIATHKKKRAQTAKSLIHI
jgi:DNA polymerase (family 10)